MNNIQAVIFAGGQGKRLGADIPKCMIDLNGKRLIDICIENLMRNGIREYVFLLGYKHELVRSHLARYNDIEIRYSIDLNSNKVWGKGKAFKHAIINNSIDRKKSVLATFPDDILLDPYLYGRMVNAHLEAVKRYGVWATLMLVSQTRYPYGVAKLDENNIIYRFEEKPLLDIPTSSGTYMFEPEVYDIIIENIDLDYPEPQEFESIIIPLLVERRRVYGFMIDAKEWLPINTRKEYEDALKALSTSYR